VGGEVASAPGRLVLRGWGRFWATDPTGARGDDEAVQALAAGRSWEVPSAEGSPPRPAPLATLDGFIARAEELGGSLRHSRRMAFAPGGQRLRFRRDPPPRFRRLGDGPTRVQGTRRAEGRSSLMEGTAAAMAQVCRPAVAAEPAAPRSPVLKMPPRPGGVACERRKFRRAEPRPREVPELAMVLPAWLDPPVGMTLGIADLFTGP
jgi:hypothetical protein